MFMSTHSLTPKSVQFRISMESVSSGIHNANSRNNEDDGEIHLKWKSEYKVTVLLDKVKLKVPF